MKITIDLSEITALLEAQNELTSLDNELVNLLQSADTLRDKAVNPADSLVLKLRQLLERASGVQPDAGLQTTVEHFASGYSHEVRHRLLYPQQQQLLREIDALKRRIQGLKIGGDPNTGINRRKLIEAGHSGIVDSIEKQVKKNLQAEFEKHFSADETALEVV